MNDPPVLKTAGYFFGQEDKGGKELKGSLCYAHFLFYTLSLFFAKRVKEQRS
jgi:hypothetical protein